MRFSYFYIMIEKIYKFYKESFKVSTDTRNIEKNSIFFALKGANFNANKFAKLAIAKGASYAIVDEKAYQINSKIILVNNVLETLQKLATYHREQLGLPIIALTGSNGKTTTKELINIVLSEQFNTTATKGNLNNHIGVPLTLLSMRKETEIGIVEFGANHSQEIAFLCEITKPDYGYITNFGKAHLEGFGSLEGVINAKTELYTYLRKTNKMVFISNSDAIQVQKSKGINKIRFGSEKADAIIKFINADPFVKLKYKESIITSKLVGNYNFSNISAAIAMGAYFNISTNNIKNAIEKYKPTNNRSQIIKTNTNEIILDAYNANPTSMQCALDNFIQLKVKNKIVILGDMFELGDYAEKEHQLIAEMLNKSAIDKVYLLGENFAKIKTNSTKIILLKNYYAFEKLFKDNKIENTYFLIKASRGMALERVLNLIN